MTYRPGTADSNAARQHSVVAICEALGVPERDWRLFTGWAETPMSSRSRDAPHQYVDVMIADRCTHPTDDLLSQLIDVEVDGQALTTDDIRRFVTDLVVCGG